MRKIGLTCLSLVVALGILGVGYAMWSDTVTIGGDVETGSVELDIVSLSHTWVYKVILTGAIEFDTEERDPLPEGQIYVASANTSIPDPVNAPKTVEIKFDNIFPTSTANISGDIVMHYVGSIPAHCTLDDITYTPDAQTEDLSEYLNVEWFKGPNGQQEPTTWTKFADPETLQLHFCDWLMVVINFDLPQDNDLMNASGTISGTLTVQQWNE